MKQTVLRFTSPITWLYNKTHWFTDKEAWGLFRFFAFGEIVGWTLLISAIIYRSFGLPEAPSVISFAGHIHGMLFGLYFIMVLLLARSMQWGIWRVGMALAAGMPPYTALVFERIMATHRKKYPKYIEPPKGSED